MISLNLAMRLRDAGLAWRPAERDAFGLPGRGMDEQVFVVSPVPALVQRYNGHPVVAFQASAEWALDYVMLAEAVWLPEEGQLREALAEALPPGEELRLTRVDGGYICAAGPASFEGPDAATAYGLALLAALGAAR
ncbi:MAG TPA: hypothetical protein PKD53_07750 [Chloroflexaceae bacterium]|nr:hypothetical protein [Chloroflexaceae bacterium]